MKRLLALLLCSFPALLGAAPAVAQDTDPPVVRVLENGVDLVDGSLFNRAVTPVVDVTDASPVTVDSTLNSATFVSGTAVSVQGIHELAVTATDDAGNVTSLTVGFEIDTTPPVFVEVLPVAGTVTNASDVTLTGRVVGADSLTVDGQAATLTGETFSAGPFPLTVEGSKTFTLVASDAAGNTAQASHSVVRDTTPPTISIGQPPAGQVRSVPSIDVVGTATDAHLSTVTVGGVAATRSGDTFVAQGVPLAEGSTELVAAAADAAGNAAEARRTVVLDTLAPNLAITDPATGSVVPDAELPVSGTVGDPHLDRVEVNGVAGQISGSTWTASVPLTEGPNTLTATAYDTLGHSATASVSVVRDSQAPEIRITDPADGVYLTPGTVTVSGTVEDEPGLTVTVNGVTATLSTGTFTASGVALVEGENRLIARITDSLGNQGSHTRIVYRDTTPPELDSSSPVAGALALPLDSKFTLIFTEPLQAPAAGSWRLEDGAAQPLAATLAQEGQEGEILTITPNAPLPSDTDVRLVLTASLVDRAGNALATPPTLDFHTVDADAPAPPVLATTPPGFVCAPSLSLTGTAEPGSVVEVTGGAGGAVTRADATTGDFSLTVDLLPQSLNPLDLTARDREGNVSDAVILNVVHDCEPPRAVSAERSGDQITVTFSEPVDPTTLSGAVTVSDAVGAVAGSVAAATGDLEAIFTSTEPLPTGALEVAVSQAVRDRAGNPLAYPFTEVLGGAVTGSFVEGRVIDNTTGRPLEGAQVTVVSTGGVALPEPLPEATTGEDGRFRIPVAAGTHYLMMLRAGHTPAFRIVASASGQGADVFDPRLTPAAASQTIPATGGSFTGSDGATLDVLSGVLAADTPAAVTVLEEQGLPTLLPYGWSPRGAVWVDLDGATLTGTATLTFPVAAPDGATLPLVRLDLNTLQWHVEALEPVVDGAVTLQISGEGAYAAVEADGGTLAPPAPTVGAVLGSSPQPVGDEVSIATLTFDPELILPAQRSVVTVTYTLTGDAASGLPVTLEIQEELTLLDGTVRRSPPYQADLVLYRAGDGTPRSVFGLVPSREARSTPLEMGAEDVGVHRYAGITVVGNVLGPTGGAVVNDQGDRIDVPSGALPEPTAVSLERRAQADLPSAVPAGMEFLGLVSLDLGGVTLDAAAALTLELGAAPAAGETGFLFQIVDLGTGPLYRPVAEVLPTASGWTTAAIDPVDLPWPGVREGGDYLFARRTVDLGFFRGTVFDTGGAALPGALVDAPGVAWVQISGAADLAGRYVLPAPLAAFTVSAEDPTTGNRGSAQATISLADERVDLDLTLSLTGPQVVSVSPADGAVDVPVGVEPTVTLSELPDPATLPSGVLLYLDGVSVPVALEQQGTLVRIRPRATLTPGATYEIRITTALKDLQGFRVAQGVTSTFTTREAVTSDQIDLTKVHLFEPDGAGMARVLGRAGAVPAGSLVFVENTTRLVSTPSVTAAADGSFDVSIQAEAGDVLLLHVLPDGVNETVVVLEVFLAPDGRGATVPGGDDEVTFTTLDDVTVRVPAGAFLQPATVTVTPRLVTDFPAPVPQDFVVHTVFELDFGGVEAQKGLQLTLPTPAGSTADEFLLTRAYRILGEDYWMLYDLMRRDGGVITTEPPPGVQQAFLRGGPRAVAQLASLSAEAALQDESAFAELDPTGLEKVTLGDRKEYLPGSANPGLYTVMESTTFLDFVAFPTAGQFAYVLQTGMDGMAAVVNFAISRLLEHDAVLIPTRLGQEYTLTGRDLSTGYKLFEQTFQPPADTGSVPVLPPDVFGDDDPPVPMGGSPLAFHLVALEDGESRQIAPGLRVELQAGTLSLTGDPGTVDAMSEVKILGLDDAVDFADLAGANGAFLTSVPGTVAGNRYLLALGAEIGPRETLELSFSEGIDPSFTGLEVRTASGADVTPTPTFGSSTAEVRLTPGAGWRAGETYTLSLLPTLADAAGNAWGEQLDLHLNVRSSEVLNTLPFDEVRDVARLGSWLFVAAGPAGLAVVDASDPTFLQNVVSGDITFPFPFNDPVTGVDVDPHGRVLVVGGGVNSFGQLKIFDPLDLDPSAVASNPTDTSIRYAAFNGSTVVSDSLGGTGTQLPEGTPRKVTILSDDQTDRWRIGLDAAPAGVTLTPTTPPAGGGEYEVTLAGTGTAGNPVTLRNLTRGRWDRVDADGTGAFSIVAMVEAGDRVELLRNSGTLAYVATGGVGLEVVDVNAFYNETPEDPNNPSIDSDVLGIYTGFGDPTLQLCNQPVSDIGGAMLDLDTLFDLTDPHPLTLVGLVGFRGVALFESDVQNVGNMSFFNEACMVINGEPHVSGLDVIEDYPFDLNGNGIYEASEYRDYIVVAHRTQGLLIVDATDRDQLTTAGHVPLPGSASKVTVDREERLLYVSGSGGGLFVVDFDRVPSSGLLDADRDAVDDRVLETIALAGNTNAPALVVPELGLAFAGGLERGLTGVAVGGPRLTAVVEDPNAGASLARFRAVSRLAPLGVPTAPETEGGPDLPAVFRVLASVPAGAGPTLDLTVTGLGPGGLAVVGAGDPASLAGLPTATATVTAYRLADDPWEEGYQLYLSDEVVALADLRAADAYVRTADETADCDRCDWATEGIAPDAVEILSGHSVGVSLGSQAVLEAVYGDGRLDETALELAAVPWDLSPAVRQEPTLNPDFGLGTVAPGTLLHSGEMTRSVTDLAIRGRGFDYAFQRTYRNQALGSGWNGRLGPGWDFGYNRRLRELPNGDVDYFDGRGRRERFVRRADGGYDAPAGRFWTLEKTSAGWVILDARHNLTRFDRFGRLVSMADHVKDSADTGNQVTLHYDAASRLTRVVDTLGRAIRYEYDAQDRLAALEDFDGRRVVFGYDASGRLTTARSPVIAQGESTFPGGLVETYAYQAPGAGDLAAVLATRNNLESVTDPKNQTWLELTYTDADGDGRAEEVTGQTWGGDPLSIAYDFTARQTTVTDRRGNPHVCVHNAMGQRVSYTDPASFVTTLTYDAEGLETSMTSPLGRVTSTTYDTTGDRRSRGNVLEVRVTPDSNGPNGSSAELVTTYEYEGRTNQPVRVVDPRGMVTEITRDEVGLATRVTEAVGETEERSSQLEYNAFGQVTRQTNPNGNVTELDYFASGASTGYLRRTVVDPAGLDLTTRFETDARGNVTAVIDPRGVRHEQAYNEVDWTISETRAASPSTDGASALGYVTTYLYDANGNVTDLRRPFGDEGASFTYERYDYGILDEVTEVRRQIQPDGAEEAIETYAYDANRNLTRRTEPEGQVTITDYDVRNLPKTITSGVTVDGQGLDVTTGAVVTTLAYDDESRRISVTDGRNNTWTSQYDGYSRPAQQTDPLGNRTATTYDDNGNPLTTESFETVAPSGERILASGSVTYDLLNRPTAQTAKLWDVPASGATVPAGARDVTTTVAYDAASNVTSTTDAEGRVTTHAYDAAERLVQVVDPMSNRTELELDPAGNTTTVSTYEQKPGGGEVLVTQSATFDALGRRSTVSDALGNTQSFLYDARDQVRFAIDPEGFATETRYDGLNRPVETLQPEGIRITYSYDESSRRTLYRDALGNETTWAYDALNRTTAVTYPDQTTWTYGYDDSHNVTQIVDANGNQIAQSFDAANRLTARTVTPGTGVLGPTSETYSYDGLHRMVQAQSGTVVTSQAYDSLSRTISESTAGQQVSYTLDDVGNRTEMAYPSGHTVAQAFDPLDRPSQIGPGTAGVPTENAVSYGYRGPHLLATTGYANGITGTRQFDAARRPTAETKVTPGNSTVFQESFAWSPRSLKTAYSRADLNGRGFAVAYDGAKRVQQAAQHPAPTTLATNNSSLAPDALTAIPESFSYQYDAAQNLTSQTTTEDDIPETEATPTDASGRNRPASINGISLSWDANGNLIQRGNLTLEYDFRNRLTRVSQGATEIAQYEYDAFNRRVTKQVSGTTETTAWSGWQAIEEHRAGQLHQRRIYGLGLDEIVRLETDIDGNGVLDPPQVPLYDDTGNVAVMTDGSGKPVERYEYTPFGEKTILVDSTAPAVEQVRWVNGDLVLEISEAVNGDALSRALDAGTLTLEKTATLETLELTVDQPVETEPQAHRRVVLTLTDPTLVAATDEVRLTLPADALEDSFLNRPSTFFELTFPWPSADTVLHDTAAPEVLEILLYDGVLQIELSEPVDLTTANASIGVGTPSLTWTASADGYTLSSVETLTDGDYTLSVGTGLQDLSGTALTTALSVDFAVTATVPKERLFEAPDPRQTTASTIGNPYGFHGLPQDAETGLVYVRNRYYDPKLGRFISADPLGYVDGPSSYMFAGYSPMNSIDPLGLDAFIVRYGEADLDVDVYFTARLLRVREDKATTDATLRKVMADFSSAVSVSWDALGPELLLMTGVAQEVPGRRNVLEIPKEQPFVSDIFVDSAPGRSTAKVFHEGNADSWMYAHEFGHWLGLKDFYREEWIRNENGGLTIQQVPDTARFGKRALESLMGTDTKFRPSSEDLKDVVSPMVSRFELEKYQEQIHHIDISEGSNMEVVVGLFEEISRARRLDVSRPVDLLRERDNVQQRRFIVKWLLRSLFGGGAE